MMHNLPPYRLHCQTYQDHISIFLSCLPGLNHRQQNDQVELLRSYMTDIYFQS
ncbi:unnamed protein product [Schistosoma curassoni]|uniref:Transposase n=1 Tax=Schistosoma curassoni TaxID=6186 RepID=A0A183KIQ4_9TREM|nr:unnamed protein product [Schistosoma curassoni]